MHPAPDGSADAPKTRRTGLIMAGGVLALLAGVLIAWTLMRSGQQPTAAPPASQGGLVIDSATPDDNLDAARPLRCFVSGQYVGELTLAQCAQRNGVATDALDVGLDPNGDLAASDQAGTVLTPLPPQPQAQTPVAADPAPAAEPQAQPAAAAAGACWRYADGQWRKLPTDMALTACVQTLFAGRCEQPGGATYGRWSQQTLRLVPGRVEVSGDNRSFRPLAQQAGNCTFPNLG